MIFAVLFGKVDAICRFVVNDYLVFLELKQYQIVVVIWDYVPLKNVTRLKHFLLAAVSRFCKIPALQLPYLILMCKNKTLNRCMILPVLVFLLMTC